MNDVRERVQVWETNLVFINLHTAVMCCWLSSYCLLCVRSSANSLSSRKTVLPCTPSLRHNQSYVEWETPAFILPDLWLSAVQIWTQLTT